MRNTIIVGGVAVVAIIVGATAFFYEEPGNKSFVPDWSVENRSAVAAVIVPFTELARGAHAKVLTRTNYLITSTEEFTKLWQMVDAKGKVPTVDFTKNYVAAVFAGGYSTGGYSIAVTKIEDTDARTVTVTLASPGSSCIVTQSTTAPYQLIELPKTSLTFAHTDQDTTTECK